MSRSFSANQFESAFKSQRLQNWCEVKHFKERPSARGGQTTFIADDKGHLLPGVKRGRSLTNFKGTWDLPARIPSHPINPTARSMEGLRRLQSWGFCPPQSAKVPRGSSSTDVGEQTRVAAQQDGVDSFHTADARPASQNRPGTGSQNHGSQTNVAASPAAQDIQAAGKDRPLSQSSAKEENSASTPTAATETQERPKTGEERPQSKISEKRGDRVASSSSSSSSRQTHSHSKTWKTQAN